MLPKVRRVSLNQNAASLICCMLAPSLASCRTHLNSLGLLQILVPCKPASFSSSACSASQFAFLKLAEQVLCSVRAAMWIGVWLLSVQPGLNHLAHTKLSPSLFTWSLRSQLLAIAWWPQMNYSDHCQVRRCHWVKWCRSLSKACPLCRCQPGVIAGLASG